MAERSSRFTVDPSTSLRAGSSQLTETTDNLGGGSLAQEVSQIRQNWADQQKPWYLLPETGFNVRLQIDQLERDLEHGRKLGETTEEILQESFQKIEQDIQGFKVEYLCEGLVLPIVLDTDVVDGQKRVIAPLYNSKLLVETVSEQERRGAVKQSLIQVEDFLLNAPPGSSAIMTSPPGPSGFEGITYLDSQTYIWQIQEGGKPRGFTIRTNMNLEENQRLLISLGIDEKNLGADSLEDKLTRIAVNPVFIRHDPGQKSWRVEDVVKIIRYVRGSDIAYKGRSFAEIYQNLENPQHLWTLDETTKRLTDQLKTFFLEQMASGRYVRRDLEIALGITILKLARSIRKPLIDSGQVFDREAQTESARMTISSTDVTPTADYKAILFQVQQLPGCNGGGTTNNHEGYIFTGTISPRHAEISTSGEKTLNCICPFCKNRVNAIISNNTITCPICNSSAPYHC
ncbi:MAG: hypothetical protein UU05_C0014G0021 [Candidatus Curtissbacteria bacterium GW2011_GWA1_40_47]|uniref:Uncharacterized protein n=1 Tax=Candidatus Curtissbacteria bacterium RIFOXYA1_FULL_41_14 TaxID=1797737 RepID=A0A1F5HD12_9BACT|nr:MAG: hypothetical protein UT95_C0010G0025 [Candidatus Curtissbacteria bacterium GW2011_GWB1_40_28]KKR60611.1 MAG: hypothetical protein UT99_C0011G0019 [Candidatus Curtissbacteria bacterium GW2011_GWA2_40_31]KKR61748.1 MAG: hypothetical protein UU00_C0008G0021 [Microgenomates group bacterium GW2011_GWC1_40_35]KKR65606.1 MAG: hypothetical protein UU05_C0014G0021 [Candidatus Curtissbacteria bacterium GW2011_GWA1_40_47]KKR76807.1 MAG: hypothetical protein UU19_C0022G0007 [Candidatus Curtissbacte